MKRNWAAGGVIVLSLAMWATVLFLESRFNGLNRPFGNYTMLVTSWDDYKRRFIDEKGRTIDYSHGEITTSEGQSYSMLRALFVDDKETFDKTWRWTKIYLRRKQDQLFGWRWGLRRDGMMGFLEDGGENSAADADSDIALALILASRRWSNKGYREEAVAILNDMWELEVIEAGGKKYLAAGNWAKQDGWATINPSYFSPYAWRIFAQVDQEHDWMSLIEPAYELLHRTSEDRLDKTKAAGLPPNWVEISLVGGNIRPSSQNGQNSDYSYDAIRVPFRIALDYKWNKSKEAKEYLENNFEQLERDFGEKGILASSYLHDGSRAENGENPSMYATALGYFLVKDKGAAEKIFEDKVVRMYSPDTNGFRVDAPYYEQNWLWFGAALYLGFLDDFAT